MRSSIRPLYAASEMPLAGMVISGAGLNLPCGLKRPRGPSGFPAPDLFDPFPIQSIDFSHLPFADFSSPS